MSKKGILLINLGTPDSPSVKDVRKYLREFLMDEYVIDMPFIPRWMLVNLIIAPFRGPKSAEVYQELWTDKGSPLLYYSEDIRDNWQKHVGEDVVVKLAMRYQKPSIQSVADEMEQLNLDELEIIPLYPQHASSSSKSSIDKALSIVKKWKKQPKIEVVENFFQRAELIEGFTNVLVNNAKKYLDNEKYDHILFSYHSIPERHILKDCTNGYCKLDNECCKTLQSENWLCYRAQCYETTRILVKKLGLKQEDYTTCFQSRLATRAKDPWLQPYTSEVLVDLAKKGKKRLLVFSPAFVADCLETIVEIGIEYAEIFKENGGEHVQLVESVNDTSLFA